MQTHNTLWRAVTSAPAPFGRAASIRRANGILGRDNIENGKCNQGVQARLSLTVHVPGPNRILRILVDTRRDHDQLLASIGHELQHAVEVLSDPHVIDNRTIYFFFDRIGSSRLGRFETHAAIHAELEVAAELRTNAHYSVFRFR